MADVLQASGKQISVPPSLVKFIRNIVDHLLIVGEIPFTAYLIIIR